MDDEELTPEQKFAAESPEAMVPRALLAGKREEDIVQDLVRLDWSRVAAESLVQRVKNDLRRFNESPESRRKLLAEARVQFAGGCLLCLFGILTTALSFLIAFRGRFPYFIVTFGLAAVGLAMAGRGWGRWRYYHRLSQFPAKKDFQDKEPGEE